MALFSKLLDEALEQTSGVSMDEFVKFSTALITSTSQDMIPVAIERAMSLSPKELAGIVKQVQFTGDTQALSDAFVSKPEFAAQFVELGRKLLPEQDLLAMVEQLKGEEPMPSVSEGDRCPYCNVGKTTLVKPHYQPVQLRCDNPECEIQRYSSQHFGFFPNCPRCGKWYHHDHYDYDQKRCKNCINNAEKEPYNSEVDYYNQGEDLDGH